MTEEESIKFQLREWLAGRAWHNTVLDDCCPDFSCCRGKIVNEKTRRAFIRGTEDVRTQMLTIFLQTMVVNELGIYLKLPHDDANAIPVQ